MKEIMSAWANDYDRRNIGRRIGVSRASSFVVHARVSCQISWEYNNVHKKARSTVEHLKSSKSCLCEPWPWRSISTSHAVPSATTQDYVSTVTVVGRNGQLQQW